MRTLHIPNPLHLGLAARYVEKLEYNAARYGILSPFRTAATETTALPKGIDLGNEIENVRFRYQTISHAISVSENKDDILRVCVMCSEDLDVLQERMQHLLRPDDIEHMQESLFAFFGLRDKKSEGLQMIRTNISALQKRFPDQIKPVAKQKISL